MRKLMEMADSSRDGMRSDGRERETAMEKELAFIMGALLCLFIVVIGLHSLFLCLLRRRLRRNAPIQMPPSGTCKGLDSQSLAALPTAQYKENKAKREGKEECVICLSHFAKGDVIRVLPVCAHKFHVGCIDRWLAANTSCPTCRQSLLTAPDTVASAADAGSCEGSEGGRGSESENVVVVSMASSSASTSAEELPPETVSGAGRPAETVVMVVLLSGE